MDIIRAKEIVSALAEGIDPTTGEILPENSVYNKGEVVRALYAVLNACNSKDTVEKRRSKEPTNYDVELYERLRVLRNRIAEESDLRPFRVFANISLMHMAAQMPTTPEEFLKIYGVGKYTSKQYGSKFLAVINDYTNNSR